MSLLLFYCFLLLLSALRFGLNLRGVRALTGASVIAWTGVVCLLCCSCCDYFACCLVCVRCLLVLSAFAACLLARARVPVRFRFVCYLLYWLFGFLRPLPLLWFLSWFCSRRCYRDRCCGDLRCAVFCRRLASVYAGDN